jgi:hypothetical protein
MRVLGKMNSKDFPLKWANLDFYPESRGSRIEIYVKDSQQLVEELILMFYTLFGPKKRH